jgi:uncharacterized membrane protein
MKTLIPIIILNVLLVSCKPQTGNPLKTNSSIVKLENDTLHLIREFEGLLISSGRKKQFISCDHPEIIHLIEYNDQIDTIIKSLLPNAYDGESIFIKMNAEIRPSAEKDYADLLVIKEFLKAEQKTIVNTCIPFDFWCKGNEPFWQLQISSEENIIDFYNPMQQLTTHFKYTKPVIKNGIIIYSSKDKKSGNEIMIRIKNGKCSDGMNEKSYNYNAEVILNGQKYNGCASAYKEN